MILGGSGGWVWGVVVILYGMFVKVNPLGLEVWRQTRQDKTELNYIVKMGRSKGLNEMLVCLYRAVRAYFKGMDGPME